MFGGAFLAEGMKDEGVGSRVWDQRHEWRHRGLGEIKDWNWRRAAGWEGCGELAGARTQDQRLKRAMLYQLSYELDQDRLFQGTTG